MVAFAQWHEVYSFDLTYEWYLIDNGPPIDVYTL